MATGKNHSIRHTPGDVERYCDAINVGCDAPEEAHKFWVKEQGVCTNQGPQAQLSMMLHSLCKEASALLCKAVQGNVCVFLFSNIYGIFCIFVKFSIFCILFITVYFTERIEDEDQIDDWNVTDNRTGERVPRIADSGYQKEPTSDPIMSCSEFSGIRIIIWNRAKVRLFITHSLAGGGSHNMGYHALRWEMILHGNAGELGKYAVLSVLPDKIARFCMNTMIHRTSLWACLLSRWTGVVSVSTASSDQIRCNCAMYISYAKNVYYANQFK